MKTSASLLLPNICSAECFGNKLLESKRTMHEQEHLYLIRYLCIYAEMPYGIQMLSERIP